MYPCVNLGPASSESLGYLPTFPLPRLTDFTVAIGRESQVGFLVGGNYTSTIGLEIEGRIVGLGDFRIGPSGINHLGTLSIVCEGHIP